jgi:ParB/RepB/Spo0J family partition protein
MQTNKVLIDSLKEFEGNPRRGNIKELIDSLKVNGQYKPIVVQKSTQQILAGNHLWKAAKELGWTEINIVELDVDDAAAKKIVVADNRLADMGAYDEQALLDLLKEMDLTGTGYVPADVDDLLALIEEQAPVEWKIANAEAMHENIQKRPTLSERAEHYAERTVRLLMCEYKNDQYIWIINQLNELRTKYDVDSNADAILHAVAELTGSEIPS